MSTQQGGIWGRGETYERYVGRWSRLVAREFVPWLDVPPGGRWLDVGCGTGALTAGILGLADPVEVHGVDPAEGFITHTRSHITDPRARFSVGDARALPVESGACDAVVAGLMLHLVPDPALVIAEFARATRPGGRVGIYVWDYVEGMEFMRHFWDVAAEFDPGAVHMDDGRKPNTVADPDRLHGFFTSAALRDVETRAIEIPTRFRDFDDYWMPFLGGQGVAPGYLATLDEDRRAAIGERLRATLPVEPDGSISLTARAWAARGRK
jgi:SAM-dependent methyltransferase